MVQPSPICNLWLYISSTYLDFKIYITCSWTKYIYLNFKPTMKRFCYPHVQSNTNPETSSPCRHNAQTHIHIQKKRKIKQAHSSSSPSRTSRWVILRHFLHLNFRPTALHPQQNPHTLPLPSIHPSPHSFQKTLLKKTKKQDRNNSKRT